VTLKKVKALSKWLVPTAIGTGWVPNVSHVATRFHGTEKASEFM